jgi:hypothetical protein
MSVVTTIMLHLDYRDAGVSLRLLHEKLDSHELGELGLLTENVHDVDVRGARWGGNKFPEVRLYGAAYNKLDLARFMEIVRSVPWRAPEHLQLFVSEQEQFKFTVYELVNGKWARLRASEATDE